MSLPDQAFRPLCKILPAASLFWAALVPTYWSLSTPGAPSSPWWPLPAKFKPTGQAHPLACCPGLMGGGVCPGMPHPTTLLFTTPRRLLGACLRAPAVRSEGRVLPASFPGFQTCKLACSSLRKPLSLKSACNPYRRPGEECSAWVRLAWVSQIGHLLGSESIVAWWERTFMKLLLTYYRHPSIAASGSLRACCRPWAWSPRGKAVGGTREVRQCRWSHWWRGSGKAVPPQTMDAEEAITEKHPMPPSAGQRRVREGTAGVQVNPWV